MTGWVVVIAVGCLLVGFTLGLLTKHAACYGEGVLKGQAQAELTRASRPVVSGEALAAHTDRLPRAGEWSELDRQRVPRVVSHEP